MAEAGTPQPDGPRPPTPRARGDRGRDPAALAAWRRVAEQRRRAVDKDTSPADRSTVEPPVVEAPLVVEPAVGESVARTSATDGAGDPAARPPAGRATAERPRVERPGAEPPTAGRAATARTGAEPPVAGESAIERPTADRPAAARPAVERPTVARPAAGRPASERPAPDRPAAPARRTSPGAGQVSVPAVRDESASGDPARPGRPARPVTRDEPPASRPAVDDGPPPAARLHDVLLGLAGRLDDDALTSVREMVAAEDDAEAAELLGGCLLAGGIGLTAQERAVLRPWFGAARVDPELLGLVPTDAGALDRSVHRFVPHAADRAPGVPLARAARRLSGVVAVRESWRLTPAGSAPGPVPHRVVLVETVGPDDCDHVVHHLAHAARALDDTSVEVFAAGVGLPAYHRAALAVARPLVADDAAAPAAPAAAASVTTPPPPAAPAPPRPTPPAPPVRPPGTTEDEETWRTVADAGTSRTGPASAGVPSVPPVPQDVEDDDEPALVDLDEPDLADPDEPELADPDEPADQPDPDVPDLEESELADPDELEEPPAARVVAPQRPAAPTRDTLPAAEAQRPDRSGPARPAASGETRRPALPAETSIDEDLSSTARRIAALWARPSPEDFSAPLPADDSLEPTRLEPVRDDVAEEPDPEDENEAPSGRHGRPVVADLGTTSFRSPRGRSRTNGHPVGRSAEAAEGRDDAAPDPTPTSSAAGDDGVDPDSAQLPRTRQPRPRDGDVPRRPDTGPARFGHDARFGAGPGPAWPGGPVTGESRPGPDTLFTSPVEVGQEPVSFGTNGHRHEPDPVPEDDEPDTLGTDGHRHEAAAVADDDEPDTGPIVWSGRAGRGPVGPPAAPRAVGPLPAVGPDVVPPPPPMPGYGAPMPPAGGPGPRRPGDPGDDVAPRWAAADEADRAPEGHGWVPDAGPARAPEPDAAASWSPDDDSVAQLSDRERELLARLHEELAQRERSEGADPFGPSRPGPQRPQGPPSRPGSPGGRVNGHGLPPGGPDDASA